MSIPDTMSAVLTTGHGGFDKLEFRDDVPVPRPGPGEILIRVAAAAINNTDINTRTGWYARCEGEDASWSGAPLHFPLIQGGDCCGQVVGVGRDVDPARIGERVIVRNILKTRAGCEPGEFQVFGSECNGAFAQYATAPAAESDRVRCDWSDAELAAVPIAGSTAEAMLDRVNAGAEHVLVTGASGGVGTAAVQLGKRRGAVITAVAAEEKHQALRDLGADRVIGRDRDLVAEVGENSMDVVVDLVAGPAWPALPVVLKRYGRYVVAGAIAGPVVEFDVRNLYLKDQTYYGVTDREDNVSENLVGYIEKGEIKPPVVARTYPLRDIVAAQEDFLAKRFVGKLVLIPPREQSLPGAAISPLRPPSRCRG